MFKNYFTTAFRNFWRNKSFSVINVLGLSIGICASLIIFLIVFYEFSFDKFEKDSDRIYRVVIDAKFGGVDGHSAAVQAPLANAIQKEVTGVELTVPVMQFQGDATAKVSVQKTASTQPLLFKKQPNIVFTNPQYFYLLPFKWIAGTPNTSLKNPFNVVLTESRAHEYFPSLPASDIIGKQINYNDDITVTVSGIVKDINQQTAFNAAEFISYATIAQTHLQDQFMMNVWNDWMAYSQLYVKLSTGRNASQIETQLKTLLAKYDKDANKDAANTLKFHLQPLNDVHFNNLYASVGGRTANLVNVIWFTCHCSFSFIVRLYQLHQSYNCQRHTTCKRNWHSQNNGQFKKAIDISILRRNFFYYIYCYDYISLFNAVSV